MTVAQPHILTREGADLKELLPLAPPRTGSGRARFNGSRDKSLVGVEGQTAPTLGEPKNCHSLKYTAYIKEVENKCVHKKIIIDKDIVTLYSLCVHKNKKEV